MIRVSSKFPFFSSSRNSLVLDVLFGAAGGALATWVMGFVMEGTTKALPVKLQKKAQRQRKQQGEEATEKVARKAAEPLGIRLQGEDKKKGGMAVHWTYGVTWGAIYGALHHRVPSTGRIFGLGFGLGLFLFGDELLVPALKLGPAPTKTPLASQVSALVGHLAYGGITEGSFRLLHRAFN